MEIIFVVFFALFLYKLKIGKNDDFLSKEYTAVIRGICAIAIMLAHIRRTSFVAFEIFNYVGAPIVAVFLFLSGYGIVTRIQQVGANNYMNGFLKKRCLPLFIEFVFVCLLYYAVKLAFTGNFEFLKSGITSPHSWYIIMIELLYILMFIGYLIFKDNLKALITFVTVAEVLIIVVLAVLKVGEYWYVSLLGFSAGMICSSLNIKKEKSFFVLVVFGIVAGASTLGELLLKDHEGLIVLWALVYNVSTLSLSFVALFVGRYVRFNNPVFKFLGSISLEIYLLHGVFEELFKEISFVNNNNLLYGAAVVASTILASYIVSSVKKSIHQKRIKA